MCVCVCVCVCYHLCNHGCRIREEGGFWVQVSLLGDMCVWGGRNGEERGESLSTGQHVLSLLCNGMGSVGRMEGGGGVRSSLLGHCLVDK